MILEEKTSVFHHWAWYYLWAYDICPYYIEVLIHFLYAQFVKIFIMRGYWILSNVFCIWHLLKCIYLNDHVIFNPLLAWGTTLISLSMMNHSHILGINFTWEWYMLLSKYCRIQFVTILLKIFESMFIRNIGLQLSFVVVSLSGFCIRVMLVL